MILVDTSVWIDHFERNDPLLVDLLGNRSVTMHPFVLGELAMGNLADRGAVLLMLAQLPRLAPARDPEVLAFIERQTLFGKGIGYIDTHLLVSARLKAGTQLWTLDKRLQQAAEHLSVSFTPKLN